MHQPPSAEMPATRVRPGVRCVFTTTSCKDAPKGSSVRSPTGRCLFGSGTEVQGTYGGRGARGPQSSKPPRLASGTDHFAPIPCWWDTLRGRGMRVGGCVHPREAGFPVGREGGRAPF